MESVKIEAPAGYEIDKEKSTFENIVFKEVKKSVLERIKTFSDVCKELGVSEDVFNPVEGIEDESDAAMRKIKAIAKVLNEGWYPDFENSRESKCMPWFEKFRGGPALFCVYVCNSATQVPAHTIFKSKGLAQHAANQFMDIYKTAFKL